MYGCVWSPRSSKGAADLRSFAGLWQWKCRYNWNGPAVLLGTNAALRLVQDQIPYSLDSVSGVSSYPSGKQWAAVRTQQDEIRLPPQRNTFSLDLLRQNMAATQGWDSTVATVPPTIFVCFLLVRCPHVDSVCTADEAFIFIHWREWSMKMTSSVMQQSYLGLDWWLWADPGLILQNKTV